MNNFFILNDAIDLADYSQFKNGMLQLNAIEKDNEDNLLKSKTIWELNILQLMCSTFGQEEQLISKFIEQIKSSDYNFTSCYDFDQFYPDNLNAFWGIDFAATSIEVERQVTDNETLKNTKRHYFVNLKCKGDKFKQIHCLKQLYKNYHFEDKAIEDITYWNQTDFNLYIKLHELLLDISDNPFQGGIGKTEVLKNQKGVASKRLNDEHRITYRLENNMIHILASKGHYN